MRGLFGKELNQVSSRPMENNVNLVAFGTFGNPSGFKQTFFIGNSELAKHVRTFDLNTNAVKLFPNTNIYGIRKEYTGGQNIISYSVYSFAKEQNSERSGTFIGSSILFVGSIAVENITIKTLNEFQENLLNKNVKNDTILVNDSKQFSVNKPSDFDKIKYNLKEIEVLDFMNNSNKVLFVYCETKPDQLQFYFEQSIDLLNVYDSIFFTQSQEVAGFVAQRGIFKFIQNVGDKNEFEKEIQQLKLEREIKIENSISDLQKEIMYLKEDKNKKINECRRKIAEYERIDQNNDKIIKDFKKELEKIENIYIEFENKIKKYSSQMKSGGVFGDIIKKYKESKFDFLESIRGIEEKKVIDIVSEARVSNVVKSEAVLSMEKGNDCKYESKRSVGDKSNKHVIRVDTFLLLVLWISTLVYFILFSENAEHLENRDEYAQETTNTQVSAMSSLSPIPNAELIEKDRRNVSKGLRYNIKLTEVVELIFRKNPNQIGEYYTGQKELYGKCLMEKNEHCFQDSIGTYFFVRDTLLHIPCIIVR